MAGMICNLKQGTEEWLELRSKCFSASDAAAMLGLSKHTKRDELLFRKYTGIEKEYSSYALNLFKNGHEAEFNARQIIEDMIDEELFAAVFKDGDLLASVDGITMDYSVAFEHKLFNLRLHDSVSKGSLPAEYMPQCQQILILTGAKKLIFVCSDGTEEKMAIMDIYPDENYFQKIIDGWFDFKRDLDNYGNREINET